MPGSIAVLPVIVHDAPVRDSMMMMMPALRFLLLLGSCLFLVPVATYGAAATGVAVGVPLPPSTTEDASALPNWLHDRRSEVGRMFDTAYGSYRKNAWPDDVVGPFSCKGESFLAGTALTQLEALGTLAVMGRWNQYRGEFISACTILKQRGGFNVNKSLSVFEASIRLLGSLLSNHLLASDPQLAIFPGPTELPSSWQPASQSQQQPQHSQTGSAPAYDGCMLSLAKDLGERLLAAFPSRPNSNTGIPFPVVNLQTGVASDLMAISLAEAGSLTLEWGLLSRLTGDPRFETAARRSVDALWRRRSHYDLFGKMLNASSGSWSLSSTSVAECQDSFYEYLWKTWVLFGDSEALTRFNISYQALLHLTTWQGWFVELNNAFDPGAGIRPHVAGLGAFFGGLRILAYPTIEKDLSAALATVDSYVHLWHYFGLLPEYVDVGKDPEWRFSSADNSHVYKLRPELAESLWYASGVQDPSTPTGRKWLQAGAEMLASIQDRCEARCGYAMVKDIATWELMRDWPQESYFLAETLKYLYLLFDPDNALLASRGGRQAWVFSTEGHPFSRKYLSELGLDRTPHVYPHQARVAQQPTASTPISVSYVLTIALIVSSIPLVIAMIYQLPRLTSTESNAPPSKPKQQ